MNMQRFVSNAGLPTVLLAMVFLGISTGCASNKRMATMEERLAMQTTLQQYATQSRLTGQVVLEDKVRVKGDTATVGYKLHDPTIQLHPLRLHAEMQKTETGWRVLANEADPTLHDLSAWPMVRPTPEE